MGKTEFNRSKVVRFLIWTFALAYGIQIGAAYLYRHVSTVVGQLVIAAMMFVPALGVLLSGADCRRRSRRPVRAGRRSFAPPPFAYRKGAPI